MKIIQLLVIFSVTLSVYGQEVKWYSWNEGREISLEQEKPMMIFIHASWCHLCQRMESKVFTNPEINSLLNESYVAIKLDAETEETLLWKGKELTAGQLLADLSNNEFRGIPAYLFLPGNHKKKARLETGLKDIEEMKTVLKKYR